ncbi:TPA: DUF3289 family protein [Photobacterium damselae]
MAKTAPTWHIRQPTEFSLKSRVKEEKSIRYSDNELSETLERIEKNMMQTSSGGEWLPVKGVPRLVYQTQRRMNDLTASDMHHGNEERYIIEQYGFMQPFSQWVGYDIDKRSQTLTTDEFTLPASTHFKRMRSLANDVMFGAGFSMFGETKDVFSKMVDKFQRNEGGIFMHPALDDAMKKHNTTAKFHAALLKCLGDNLNKGVLPTDIVEITRQYLSNKSTGERLPKLDWDMSNLKPLFSGEVLTVHDIWSMNVYVDKLEYKGNQVRGNFRYEIQDHFGLDAPDVNHNAGDGLFKQYEYLDGFRSWYLLQHYVGYNYKPFITEIRFEL